MRILRVCLKELLRGLNGLTWIKCCRIMPELRRHSLSVDVIIVVIIIITNLFSLDEFNFLLVQEALIWGRNGLYYKPAVV